MKGKMQIAKLLVVNYAVFVTLLITIELIGQLGYWIFRGRFLYETPPNQIFKEHPYLSGISKKEFHYVNSSGLSITTDRYGFRKTRTTAYEKDAINVICLGGSTTFGTFVTDENSWPFMLQEKLGKNYNVYNLGVPGYSTLEGIIQLITFVPELDPHIIIIYEGWNDIRNYHIKPHSPDYYWHGMSQKTNLEFGARDTWDNFFISKVAKKLGQTIKGFGRLNDTKAFTTNDPYIDSLYVKNLRTMKLLCDNLNSKMIFIPQVLNFDSLKNSTRSNSWTPTINNNQMPMLMENFNALMRKAISSGAQTIVIDDILRKQKWTKEYFADYGHFNEAGGELFSQIILESIKALEAQDAALQQNTD